MSEIYSSKRSSESIKTQSSVSFVLDLIEEPTKIDSVGVFELKKRWDFSGLAFICLFLNQVKSLSDVDCNFEIIVSVSGGKVTTVVTCASMKEVLPKLPLW